MIGTAPFPFANLAGSRSPDGRSKTHDEAPDQNAGRISEPPGGTAFEPFGPDPKTTSEPERLYTADDLAKAVEESRRQAAEETETKLRDVFANDLERRRVELLSTIKDQLDRYRSAFDGELNRLADVSQRLALALGEALIPRALEGQPLADIADILKSTLVRLTKEPSVELRLPPELIETGEAMLADIANEVGFPGEVIAVADAALDRGDVTLRWMGGAVERRTDRLQAEAGELVERWLQDVPEAGDQPEVPPSPMPPESSISVMPSDHEPDAGSEQQRATP